MQWSHAFAALRHYQIVKLVKFAIWWPDLQQKAVFPTLGLAHYWVEIGKETGFAANRAVNGVT